MKIIGILLVLNSIAITGWWVGTHGSHKFGVITVCLIAVFAGLVLILNERITEITVKGVGSISASAEQAQTDAEAISQVKTRVETQSATVDLVADKATKAQELSEEVAKQNKKAEEKLATLDSAIGKAKNSLEELESTTEFTTTVVAAQNDDRDAFDQLEKWAKDACFRFSVKAGQAWHTILDDHSKPYHMSGFEFPWPEGFDPSELTLSQLEQQFSETLTHLKPALLEYIWKRNDFPKKDRLSFMMNVMKTDKSLKVVEYAGIHFTSGTSQEIKPIAVEHLSKWWDENKSSFED